MPSSESVKYGVTGVAVMVAWGEAFQVFGALNSSPWTAENFGADPQKAASMRNYVRMAFLNNVAMGALGSYLTGSWLPIIVTMAVSAWMAHLYEKALHKGGTAGSVGWANGGAR
jgi:fatty-acid desaturase